MELRPALKVRVSIFLLLRSKTRKHQPCLHPVNTRSAPGTGGCWSESSLRSRGRESSVQLFVLHLCCKSLPKGCRAAQAVGCSVLCTASLHPATAVERVISWGRQGCQEPPEPRRSIKVLPLGLIALMCNEDVQKWSNHHQPLKRANR